MKPLNHFFGVMQWSLGELVQLDASLHDWFEGRGDKCVLIGYIDDASNLVFLRFAKGETTDALY